MQRFEKAATVTGIRAGEKLVLMLLAEACDQRNGIAEANALVFRRACCTPEQFNSALVGLTQRKLLAPFGAPHERKFAVLPGYVATPPKVGVGTKVLGVPISEEEHAAAAAILMYFNEKAGTQITLPVRDHLRMLVGRLRDCPSMTLEDFQQVIDANLAQPWWKGRPSLNVIFGPTVWANALTRARAAANGEAPDKAIDRVAASHANADDFREAARRLKEKGL